LRVSATPSSFPCLTWLDSLHLVVVYYSNKMRACQQSGSHFECGNSNRQKIGERGPESMAKKGELSKTARASLANREEVNHLTSRICAKCGEAIMLKDLQPVKVVGKGMVFYHRSHYNMQ